MAGRTLSSMKNIDTTKGVIWKQLVLFTLPILISNFIQQLYGTIDMIIVGNYANEHALSAVGTTTSLTNVLLGLFVGISTGASVALAQAYGADDTKSIFEVVHATIFWGIASGAILTIIGVIFTRPLLVLMNCPASLLDDASLYMTIVFLGMIPQGVYNMASAILRAVGDSTRPLYFLIVAAVTNLVLDYVFVAALSMGVAGAAIATVVSQLVSAVLALISLTKSNSSYTLYWREIKPYKDASKVIMKIGLPAGLQAAIISSSNAIIQSQVNKFGEVVVEGYSAFNRIDGFYYMCIDSFSISATTFVGQNIGAKKYERVKKGVRTSLLLAISVSFIIGIIVEIFKHPILAMFNIREAAFEYAEYALRIDALCYWIFAVGDVYSGTLRGAGKSLYPMISSLVNMFGVRILWVYGIQNFSPTFQAVFLAYVVSWTGQAIMMSIFYYSKRWLPEEGKAAFAASGRKKQKEEQAEKLLEAENAPSRAEVKNIAEVTERVIDSAKTEELSKESSAETSNGTEDYNATDNDIELKQMSEPKTETSNLETAGEDISVARAATTIESETNSAAVNKIAKISEAVKEPKSSADEDESKTSKNSAAEEETATPDSPAAEGENETLESFEVVEENGTPDSFAAAEEKKISAPLEALEEPLAESLPKAESIPNPVEDKSAELAASGDVMSEDPNTFNVQDTNNT